MKIFDWIFDLRGPQKNVADGYLHVRVEREQKDLKNEKIADKQEINFISSSEETEKTQGLHIGDKVNTKYGKGKLIKKNPGIYKVQLPYGIALLTKNDIEKNEDCQVTLNILKTEKILETEKIQGLYIGGEVNTKYGKGKLIEKNPEIYTVQLSYGIALLSKNDIKKNELIPSSGETEKTQGLDIGDEVNTKYGKGKLIEKNPEIYKVQLPYGIALLTKNDIEKNESSAKLKKLNRWTSLHDKVDDLYTCHTQFGNWDIVNECIHEKVKFVEKHSAIPLLIGCVAVGAISVASIIMIKKYMKYKLNFSTE